MNTGEVQQLAENWRILGWKPSPDGRSVAVLRYVEAEPKLQQFYFDLTLLPLDGSPPQVIARRIPQEYGVCFNWSPDSHWLAYTTQERGKQSHLFVVAADGSTEPEDLSDPTVDMQLLGEIEAPRWSLDSTRIYCLAKQGYWEWTIRAHGRTEETTRRYMPLHGKYNVLGWVQSPTTATIHMMRPGYFCVLARNPRTKDTALIEMEISSGHEHIVAELSQCIQWPTCEIEIAHRDESQESEGYLVLQASHHPAEIWRFQWNDQQQERVLSFNPDLSQVAVGTSRLIEYRALDGQPGLAALLLPPTYREGEPIPIIVEVYGGAMNANHLHGFGVTQDVIHGQILVNHGYGLLTPDMPLKDHDPLSQLSRHVLPAIMRLIDQGIADPKRIGLMGQSYGGYSTLALLTQTQIFSAAVACAGTYNLIASYFTLGQVGNDEWLGWCESGQGRMGGSLWEKRPAYIENSPLFYLERVTAPVLLLCGGQDPGAPEQAAAAFIGLRRLKKKVEYRCYQDEGHWSGTWNEASYRDLCGCVLSWFDKHLAPDAGM
ncbi:hypothetical protein KSC_001070 [Ktedonobacter sp. SOSP1-52]|uniref:S9 family peptidase n=1 Tax=Ktedonobacter sp. SOSP1-52 TaxID=2778366 RepID=UPI00191609B1|nr:prolyl oligopeptidase family serine peptidase [Ktedonobacter sp. SOSP1-52]GHO61215.1 hypothetical protein KSC_001070 [Ktedonobacter sp. SOSP1-52]